MPDSIPDSILIQSLDTDPPLCQPARAVHTPGVSRRQVSGCRKRSALTASPSASLRWRFSSSGTALSGLTISYYWLPPRYSFAVSELSDLLGLVIFLAVGLLISVINERQLRHATAVLAALRKSEQRYRLLFRLNPAGMFQSRRDGQILECNDAFVRLLGFSSRGPFAQPARVLRQSPGTR